MSDLQVLMPMGGLGSRFTAAGYTTPKPLIEVDGKPMFMRALESFSKLGNVQHIFVIRNDQDNTFGLSSKILDQLPGAKICILDHDTNGAVESCLAAKEFIDDDTAISIADCDIYFESKEYFRKAIAKDKPDGMLLTFHSNDPRYSYAEKDSKGNVIRTAEKIAISNNAILGGYYFSSGRLFKNLAETFMLSPLPAHLKEYYISHLFNILVERNGHIEIANIDKRYIFGTPEELQEYLEGKQ